MALPQRGYANGPQGQVHYCDTGGDGPALLLLHQAPLSLRHAKAALNTAVNAGLDETFGREAQLQHICVSSEDAREGMRAVLAKRAPEFKGR